MSTRASILLFLAAAAIFVAVHVPVDTGQQLFQLSRAEALTLRGVLFATPMLALLVALAVRIARLELRRFLDARVALLTLLTSAVLALLAYPTQLRAFGRPLSKLSVSPFDQNYGFYHRRLFHGFLAEILGFRGDQAYLVFTVALYVVLLYLVWIYLFGARRTARPRLPAQSLLMLSLGTCSFVIFGYQFPGYGDVSAFIALVLLVLLPLDDLGGCILIVVALAATEASSWVLAPLLLLAAPRRNRWRGLALIGLYWLIWIAAMRFDVAALVSLHTTIGQKSGFTLLRQAGATFWWGVFFAYKLWWLLFIAMIVAIRAERRRALAGAALVGSAFLMLPLMDTSRLIGWGFLGLLLVARAYIDGGHLGRPRAALFYAVAALNLLVPSLYAGTNMGCTIPPGLYGAVAARVLPARFCAPLR